MQREAGRSGRVRGEVALARLRASPGLVVRAVIVVLFFGGLYGYGFWSCRPGGRMFEKLRNYEAVEAEHAKLQTVRGPRGAAMVNMTGTWLALPLKVGRPEVVALSNWTCGGTVGGARPAPGIDLWVCMPAIERTAEESWVVWKQSAPPLLALSAAFVILSWPFREKVERASRKLQEVRQVAGVEAGASVPMDFRQATLRRGTSMNMVGVEEEASWQRACRCRWHFLLAFGLAWLVAAHGVVGGAIMLLLSCVNFGLSRAVLSWRIGRAQLLIWIWVLGSMEAVFRILGDAPHQSPHVPEGVRYWSRLEGWFCDEEDLRRATPRCLLARPFAIKGFCPWFLYRFVALKFISYALDVIWRHHRTPSDVPHLDLRADLVQRTERNDQPWAMYRWQCYIAYVMYTPLYAVGPILSYNAFVSQIQKPQTTYSKKDISSFGVRVFFLILFLEAFQVAWWYAQLIHIQTCEPTGRFPNTCVIEDLGAWELFLATHTRLQVTWMALMVIWRVSRLVALIDGVDTPENMLACVSLQYTFEAFWRIWHSSMNRFMQRYLYGPIGGRDRNWLAVPVVFGFVAYWHETTGFMTYPWWYFWAGCNAVGVIVEKAVQVAPAKEGAPKGPVLKSVWRFISHGLGPIILIAFNVPALFYGTTLRFYRAWFLDGWQSATLMATLIVVFGCIAHLTDALRAAPVRPPSIAAPREESRRSTAAKGTLKRASFEMGREDCMLVEVGEPHPDDHAAFIEASARATELQLIREIGGSEWEDGAPALDAQGEVHR